MEECSRNKTLNKSNKKHLQTLVQFHWQLIKRRYVIGKRETGKERQKEREGRKDSKETVWLKGVGERKRKREREAKDGEQDGNID